MQQYCFSLLPCPFHARRCLAWLCQLLSSSKKSLMSEVSVAPVPGHLLRSGHTLCSVVSSASCTHVHSAHPPAETQDFSALPGGWRWNLKLLGAGEGGCLPQKDPGLVLLCTQVPSVGPGGDARCLGRQGMLWVCTSWQLCPVSSGRQPPEGKALLLIFNPDTPLHLTMAQG